MNLEILNSTIIIAILTSTLTIIGSFLFFEYKFKKDKTWKKQRKQLTKLLLPLFFTFKNHEFSQSELLKSDTSDEYEIYSEEPKIFLKKILPIIKNNLYLADDELHESCLMFLEWAYNVNIEDRYQKSYTTGVTSGMSSFKNMVFKKYYNARKNYLK